MFIVVALKNNIFLRFCVGYFELNDVKVRVCYSTLHMEECVESLGDTKLILKIEDTSC